MFDMTIEAFKWYTLRLNMYCALAAAMRALSAACAIARVARLFELFMDAKKLKQSAVVTRETKKETRKLSGNNHRTVRGYALPTHSSGAWGHSR